MGARFSAIQTAPGAQPASCTMGIGSFPGVESSRGVTLTPRPLLVPRSKKQSRPIPLLSLRAFAAYKQGETYLHSVDRIKYKGPVGHLFLRAFLPLPTFASLSMLKTALTLHFWLVMDTKSYTPQPTPSGGDSPPT